jgi:hypothetical protein
MAWVRNWRVVPEITVRAVRAAPKRRDRDTNEIIPKTCPTFRDDSSIRYDVRTYRLMRLDQVSLYTLSGRVIGQLELGDFQRRTLYDRSWKCERCVSFCPGRTASPARPSSVPAPAGAVQ